MRSRVTNIVNLEYRDPNGNPASAYVVRAWFSDGSHSDGLYCANTRDEAFRQCLEDREEQAKKWFPGRETTRLELLEIDGGIKDGEPVV